MRPPEEQRWPTGSWQQRLQRAAAAGCGGAAAVDGRSACHGSGYGGGHEQSSATSGPSKPTTMPPRLHTLACIYKELGHMVFTKKKNLLKGWMWVVRGHELVPGIQKGTHAMELREDGEPCVPPERSRWRAVALLLPHQARMSPLGGRVEAVAVMSSRVGMPSSKSLLWMMEVLMELKILVWCSSLPRPTSSATR